MLGAFLQEFGPELVARLDGRHGYSSVKAVLLPFAISIGRCCHFLILKGEFDGHIFEGGVLGVDDGTGEREQLKPGEINAARGTTDCTVLRVEDIIVMLGSNGDVSGQS